MNILDVAEVPPTNDILASIFKRQAELVDKYASIEGIPQPFPLHPDIAENQIWFKDFLWRVAEELAESWEAKRQEDKVHQIEELSDALHFLTELCLMLGLTSNDIVPRNDNVDPLKQWWPNLIFLYKLYAEEDPLSEYYFKVWYNLGLVGNCLKNKKWKQSQMPTDVNKLKDLVIKTYHSLLALFNACECSAEETYIFYWRKSAVNQFRQRTNY